MAAVVTIRGALRCRGSPRAVASHATTGRQSPWGRYRTGLSREAVDNSVLAMSATRTDRATAVDDRCRSGLPAGWRMSAPGPNVASQREPRLPVRSNSRVSPHRGRRVGPKYLPLEMHLPRRERQARPTPERLDESARLAATQLRAWTGCVSYAREKCLSLDLVPRRLSPGTTASQLAAAIQGLT